MLDEIGPVGQRPYWNLLTAKERIQIFTRVAPETYGVRESSYFTMLRFSARSTANLLVVAAHLPSQLWYEKPTIRLACENLAGEVSLEERKYPGHSTVIIGDLNLNPYDEGIVGAKALHAVPARQIAERGRRKVLGRLYPLFYNPSWRLFVDSRQNPGGTYYRGSNDANCHFWHVLDQVLVRPALLRRLPVDCLRVLDNDGLISFRGRSGKPDPRISDHLPILFSLKS
jgi:hypothetical protein